MNFCPQYLYPEVPKITLTYFDLCLVAASGTYSPQTTCLHPALSCAAASIFLQLYLYPDVHISFSRSLLRVFLGRPKITIIDFIYTHG